MRKNAEGAKELKKKMDKLSEPEKGLVLAFIKGMETGAALRDGSRRQARTAVKAGEILRTEEMSAGLKEE